MRSEPQPGLASPSGSPRVLRAARGPGGLASTSAGGESPAAARACPANWSIMRIFSVIFHRPFPMGACPAPEIPPRGGGRGRDGRRAAGIRVRRSDPPLLEPGRSGGLESPTQVANLRLLANSELGPWGGGGSSSLKGPSRGALGGCFWGPFAMSLQGEEPLALSLFSPPGETGGGMKGHDEHGETEMRGEARRGVCRRLLKRPTHRHARPGSKSRTLAHLAPVTGAVDLLEAGVSMESRLGFCQQRQNDEN